MANDAFALRVLAKELNILLSGGKINKINQPTSDEILFSVYTSGKTVNLIASANAETARVCLTKTERQNPQVAPNFCMLLRKHLSGAVIKKVDCLGWERIIRIDFEARNDFKECVEKSLLCEIMGKYSNTILVENGKILGSIRPSFGDISSARVLFVGSKYTLPPAQDKVEITDKTRVLEGFLAFSGGDVAKLTSAIIKGISTRTAEEAVYTFFGKREIFPSTETMLKYYDFLLKFLLEPNVKPNVCESGKADFFAIDCTTISGQKKYFNTLLEAEEYFFDKLEGQKIIRQKSKVIEEKLRAQEKKLNRKVAMLSDKILSSKDYELNKIKGELLTAYQHSIPTGKKECEVVNYYSPTGETIKITLDEDLSINRNAQNYYKKYQKQKKTIEMTELQLKETNEELDYVKNLFTVLACCEKPSDYDCLSEELKSAGLIKEQGKQKKKQLPSMPRTFEKDGFLIKIGRNNLQNDEVTFSANREDIWLHTKAFHSAHVIVETKNRPLPDEVLLTAAELCAHYSEAKGQDRVPVDYCQKKFVKKPPKAKPGAVIYTDYKTVLVTAKDHNNLIK